MDDHVLDPSRLQTSFNIDAVFNPSHGDLFVPEDMREALDRKGSDGQLLGPSFTGKKMVMIGPQGSGKTSLFNRLTGATSSSESGARSVTQEAVSGFAQGPASDLTVTDTPGTASNTSVGMTVREAMEVRRALTSGTVSQVVVVVSPPTSSRSAGLVDLFEGALAKIFDCNTFKCDAAGVDLSMQGSDAERSPRRPRAFVVVTHRDRVEPHREHFPAYVEAARRAFPWIGPVAFIDQRVSLGWLYDTVVSCAGYQLDCCTNHTIPLVEMFCKFKMETVPLRRAWEHHILAAKRELRDAMDCAVDQVEASVRQREADGSAGGKYEDTVAHKIDCIINFVDDLFETKTQETLATCFDQSFDDLWASTDEHENNDKVNMMNAIKIELAPTLQDARKMIRNRYPDSGEAAIYKRCPNKQCGAVYTKPTGCDYLGRCGWKAGVKKDATHPGRMDVQFRYDFAPADREEGRRANLMILERTDSELGDLEQLALRLRRNFRDAAMRLPIHQLDYQDMGDGGSDACFGDYGCGRELRWTEMTPLTRDELEKFELVPTQEASPHVEPAQDPTTMPVETFLRSRCGVSYLDYLGVLQKNELKTAADLINVGPDDLRAVLEAFGVPVVRINVMLGKLRDFKAW